MRRMLSVGLIVAISGLGMPWSAVAANPPTRVRQDPPQTGTIGGTAKDAKGEKLPKSTVRVRNVADGTIAAEVVADAAGAFSVTGLAPATYVVEIVNAAGQVVGLSSAVAVAAGTVATVTVTATAVGAIAAAAAGGGFSLLGLGTLASVAVVSAAGVAAVAGVVASRNTASPSK